MKCSLLGKVFVPLVAVVLVMPLGVGAAPTEPNPDGYCRDLRTDYVKTWYIYNDSRLDGILNPGDTMITTFNNWWIRNKLTCHSKSKTITYVKHIAEL